MANAIPDPVELTRELIRFDTVNPPGRERQCAEFLANLLREAAFEVTLIDLEPDRTSLVARLPRVSNATPLVLTGHIDVVPLGTRPWSRGPFSAECIDGRLYGRGSSDMKGGVAAMVCAALSVKDDPNPANLMLVITAGEETGCLGAASLVANGALGPAAAMVVGEPTSNSVCVGHKGALWLRATTTGITAHGSMPERGENAIYKAARVVSSFESFTFDCPAHAALGQPTLSVNTFHGGININSIPDRAEIGVDIRTVPGVDHAALCGRLQERVGADAEIEALLDLPGVWTSPHLSWVQRVACIAAEVTGEPQAPGAATFFTDASVLSPAMGGPRTIILGPGEPSQAHQTDEWCSIARISQSADIYTRILRHWARSGA